MIKSALIAFMTAALVGGSQAQKTAGGEREKDNFYEILKSTPIASIPRIQVYKTSEQLAGEIKSLGEKLLKLKAKTHWSSIWFEIENEAGRQSMSASRHDECISTSAKIDVKERHLYTILAEYCGNSKDYFQVWDLTLSNENRLPFLYEASDRDASQLEASSETFTLLNTSEDEKLERAVLDYQAWIAEAAEVEIEKKIGK